MKALLACLMLIGLLGCAHAQTTSWSKDEFTVCCSNCGQSDWEKEISKSCSGEYEVIGGGSQEEITGAQGFGAPGQRFYVPTKRKSTCRVMKCSESTRQYSQLKDSE